MRIDVRARVAPFAVGFAVVAGVSCADRGTTTDDAGDSHASRAALELMPAICESQPWQGIPHYCGNPVVVEGRRATCDELALPPGGTTVTLDQFQSDATGYSWADITVNPDFRSKVYTNTNIPRPGLNHWGLTTEVKPDGTTMTADAIIFWGEPNEGSVVFRFDPPEFYVRNMQERFVTKAIQVCGYRPGRAGGLPPSPNASVTCGFPVGGSGVPGSSVPPGPTIFTLDAINYDVTVTPAPPDGSSIARDAVLRGDSEMGFGVSYHPLTGGYFTGGYSNQFVQGNYGVLELRFYTSPGENSCSLFWNLAPPGSGHTW
jgi:hypothetical protein